MSCQPLIFARLVLYWNKSSSASYFAKIIVFREPCRRLLHMGRDPVSVIEKECLATKLSMEAFQVYFLWNRVSWFKQITGYYSGWPTSIWQLADWQGGACPYNLSTSKSVTGWDLRMPINVDALSPPVLVLGKEKEGGEIKMQRDLIGPWKSTKDWKYGKYEILRHYVVIWRFPWLVLVSLLRAIFLLWVQLFHENFCDCLLIT